MIRQFNLAVATIFLRRICLMILLFTVVSASAGQPSDPATGWYIGLGVGEGEMEVVGHDRSEEVRDLLAKSGIVAEQVSAGEDDGTDTYKILAGYRFNRFWLLEASWQDLGDTDGAFHAQTTDASLIGRIESEYNVAALMLIGQYPVFERTNLLLKAGVHRWEHEFELEGNGLSYSDSNDDMDYMYGVGASFDLADSFVVRVEWERFDGVEDEDGADVKSINLIYEL